MGQQLRNIYNNNTDKSLAITKLAHWYNDVENLGIKSFNTIMNTIKINYDSRLNYFDNKVQMLLQNPSVLKLKH